jgi:RNA polymerase-binding transcription factor DksA
MGHHNRKYLEDERARLQGGLISCGTLVLADGGRPGYGTHMADDAWGVFEQANNLAVSDCLRSALEKVDRALARMDDGNYGVCEHCGLAIDAARLTALPYATLCVACQTQAERRGAFR